MNIPQSQQAPRSHAHHKLAALSTDTVTDLSVSDIVQKTQCSRSTIKRWRRIQKAAAVVRVNLSTQPSKQINKDQVAAFNAIPSTTASTTPAVPQPTSEQIDGITYFAEFMSLVHLALQIITFGGSKALCELDCTTVMALLNVFLHPKCAYQSSVLPFAASMTAEAFAAKVAAVEQHPTTVAYVVHHGLDKAHSSMHLHILSRNDDLHSLYAQVGYFSSQLIRKTPAQVLSYFERNSNLRRSLDNVHYGSVSRPIALLTSLLHFNTQLGQRKFEVDRHYNPIGDHTAAFDLAQYIYHHGFPPVWDELIEAYRSVVVPPYDRRARPDRMHLGFIAERLRNHNAVTAGLRQSLPECVELRDPAFFDDLARLIPPEENDGVHWSTDETRKAVVGRYLDAADASAQRFAEQTRLQAQHTDGLKALVDYGPGLAVDGLAADPLLQQNVLFAALTRYRLGAYPGLDACRQRLIADNAFTPADVINTRLEQLFCESMPSIPDYVDTYNPRLQPTT